jgi:hypothetical protein
MRGNVVGSVVHAGSNRPVARAEVSVLAGPVPTRELGVLTNEAGRFDLRAWPPGRWRLRATGPLGERGEGEVQVFNDAVSDLLIETDGGRYVEPRTPVPGQGGTPATRSSGGIRGRVVLGVSGRPIADAAITILRGAGPAPDIAPLTNADGAFALDDLPSGVWSLRAVGPDGQSGETTVVVLPGTLSDARITLGAQSDDMLKDYIP